MIHILVKQPENRLIYTLSVMFETIFQIPYNIILLEKFEANPAIFTLNYTSLFIPNTLQIPNKSFVSEGDKHKPFLLDEHISFRQNWEVPPISPQAENVFPFDIFSAVFYLLSDYEKYQFSFFDAHQRYDEKSYPSYKMQLFKTPLVTILCDELLRFFPNNLRDLAKKNKKYTYKITFDIDNPWKHKHKALPIQVAGFVKNILACNKENLFERWTILKGRKDVNDTFEEIISLCPPSKTQFFCLIDRHSVYDTRFTYKHPQLRLLLQSLSEKGYAMGIHPSYTSFDSEKKIAFETEQLTHIINVPITDSRQHFLRYRLPDTFRYLQKAGITEDYTLCLRNDIGFPCGMALPFKWYDLEKEEISNLTLHPTLAMDRALQQYMQLSPAEALEKVRDLVETVRQIGGEMVMVFHNESLSESGEWKGWSEAIREMIAVISSRR